MFRHAERRPGCWRNTLLAATGMIAAGPPFAFGQGSAGQQPKPTAAVEPSAQSIDMPDWQKVAGGKMSFDLASIRLSKPGSFTPPNIPFGPDEAYHPTGGLLKANFPLMAYIAFAYKLWLTQEQEKAMVAHLPKWVATDTFIIQAKVEGNPTKDQMRLMMQSLLTDRFKLALHFEPQEVPVLALSLVKPGKLGPRLHPHADGPPCDVRNPDIFPFGCDGYNRRMLSDHVIEVGSRNTTMGLLSGSLPMLGNLGRPVVDQTGLSGRFDFTLEWTPESNQLEPAGADVQPELQGTTFLEALKEQLGLQLKSTKATLDAPVIDRVERPSEN